MQRGLKYTPPTMPLAHRLATKSFVTKSKVCLHASPNQHRVRKIGLKLIAKTEGYMPRNVADAFVSGILTRDASGANDVGTAGTPVKVCHLNYQIH